MLSHKDNMSNIFNNSIQPTKLNFVENSINPMQITSPIPSSLLHPTYNAQDRDAQAEYILCCDHKPLEPFLSKGIKVPKLDWWAMVLADYNITFVYLKSSSNILVDAVSKLKNCRYIRTQWRIQKAEN